MIKKLVAVVILSALAFVCLSSRKEVRAYPGMMCFNAAGCGRCEVCVKDTSTSPSGTCHVLQGCH